MKLTMKPFIVAGLSSLLVACGGDDVENATPKQLFVKATEQTAAKDAKYNFAVDALVNIPSQEMGQVQIKADGALDLKSFKLEVTPDISMAMFNIKLPMSFDLDKQQALVDPASILPLAAMFAPEAAPMLDIYKNKFVRFDAKKLGLKDDQATELKGMLNETVDIFLASSSEAQATLEDSAFKKLELDETAKQLNAAAVVVLNLNAAQAKALDDKFNSLVQAKVENSKSLPAEFKQGMLKSLKEQQNAGDVTNTSETKLYINQDGQAIRQVSKVKLTIDGDTADVAATIDFSNYGKPTFKIAPKEDQIVDFDMTTAMGAAAMMQ